MQPLCWGFPTSSLGSKIMDIIINNLDLLLAVTLAYAIWSYISSRRCSECGQSNSSRTNFCSRCGAGLKGDEKNQAVVYLNKRTVLRRTYIIMFIFAIGMPLLWLFSLFEVTAASTLMVVFSLYAVIGALVVVFVYRRLSRCPACGSFVSLHHDKSQSANYCETCGIRIDAQQGNSSDPKTSARF